MSTECELYIILNVLLYRVLSFELSVLAIPARRAATCHTNLDVVSVQHELCDFDERLPDVLGQFARPQLSEQRLQVLLRLLVGGQRHFVFDGLPLGSR